MDRLNPKPSRATSFLLRNRLYTRGRIIPKGTSIRIFNRNVLTSSVTNGMILILLYQGIWFAYLPMLTSMGKNTR
ncbi:hypothetical protein D3C73_1527140 [compost metagenome]